jgi:N-ethylmaleimide reductase
MEVTKAVVDVWGADRVGIRLSPSGTFNDMADSNPEAIFTYVLTELSYFNLAYLHIVDALEGDIRHGAKVIALDVLHKAYQGNLMVCGGYDQVRAETTLAEGWADAVAFGQLYIANPDLVERFQQHAPLNPADPATFYGGDAAGYIDYPSLAG